jgi:hypothetical protein
VPDSGQTTFSNLITIELKISHFFDITRHQKISHIVAYQTFIVKPCYNGFMGRNHFSRAGGPYFINDGLSKHHDHDKPEHIKPDTNLFYGLTILFVSLLSFIAITLLILN